MILVIMPVCSLFHLSTSTKETCANDQRKETPMYVEIKKIANQGLKSVS